MEGLDCSAAAVEGKCSDINAAKQERNGVVVLMFVKENRAARTHTAFEKGLGRLQTGNGG